MTDQFKNNLTNFYSFISQLLVQVNYELEVETGRKYIKLIMKTSSNSRSVWCFIDKTSGDILKPASWRAPAKTTRGNINQPNSYQNYQWTGPHYLR